MVDFNYESPLFPFKGEFKAVFFILFEILWETIKKAK